MGQLVENRLSDLKSIEGVQIAIRNTGKTKADKKYILALEEQLQSRYCLYDDLKDLYEKVMPTVDKFQ